MFGHCKSRKKVIIGTLIFLLVLLISYSAFIFRTINPIKAFDVWKSVVIDGNDICIIKKGGYAGGDSEISMEGYVFSTYDYSSAEVMGKIGFNNIGHIYDDGKKKQTEYCTSESGLHAIVEGRFLYLGGYLLKYKIVGMV